MFSGVTTILLLLVIKTNTQKCNERNSVDITNGTRLSNGAMSHGNLVYRTGEYYIDNGTNIVRGCICLKKTCIYKCCQYGRGYNRTSKTCEPVGEPFDPPVVDMYGREAEQRAVEKFLVFFGKRECTQGREIRVTVTDLDISDFYILPDGKLYVGLHEGIPPWEIRTPDKYCIDNFLMEDDNGQNFTKMNALVCVDEDVDHNHYVLSSTCMLISCVFILATVAVYIWLPELHTLHGWVLVAYLTSFFFGFLFMATMQILLVMEKITNSPCVCLTFFIYFFLLSAFFWLNVMCFDIWWTFSGKRGMPLEKLSSVDRFRAYCMYAFGLPTLLLVLMLSLEFSGLPKHPLMPNIRNGFCFLYGISKLLYLYGPIVILCIANMIFFTLTALKIAKINKQTAMLNNKESASTRRDKQRLILYIKLFALMGVNWFLEVISVIYPDLEYIWRYTDAYNVLLGVVIFIIFVCKRKIFRLMKKRYNQSKRGEMTYNSSSRTLSSREDFRMSSVKN